MRFFIKPKEPFNFDLIGNFYSRFPVQCVDHYDKRIYQRALKIKKKIYLVKVKLINSTGRPKLSAEILPNIPDKKIIEEKIKWILGIEEDIKEFYKIAKKDKKFTQIIKKLYGLRAPKTPTVFEALIIAITEQQIALPVAILMRKGLVEKYGESIKVGGKKYYTFPTPESLARIKPEDIKKLKFSLKKSEYIVNISQRIAFGEIDLEKMKNWDKEKILNTLTKIRGIGPWTVEYMMCRGMGRYDALPANDLGLRTSLTKHLGRKERVSEQEVRKFLGPFGKYQGFAAFYLIYTYSFKKHS
jgi:DNA-3-methyladenine glycosylase II